VHQFTAIHRYFCDFLVMDDLPNLAELFGCDHEDLGGRGKSAKIRELVLWIKRHGGQERLLKLVRVLDLFRERLSLPEVRTMAFDLGIDLDSLGGGSGKVSRIFQLYYLIGKQGRARELEKWLRTNRPDILC